MIAEVLFFAALMGVGSVFLLYRLVLSLTPRRVRSQTGATPEFLEGEDLPTVTGIIAVRNAVGLVDMKVRNCLALDYPPGKLSFIFYSDGSTDGTTERLREWAAREETIHVMASTTHGGKIAALNEAARECSSDLLLFTDVDALLAPDSLRLLARHYSDESVGGVCGRRVIGEEDAEVRSGQDRHFRFHAGVQALESQVGSVTANEGKIYIMRRDLFEPIAASVTDDLYTSLCVVRRGFRFIYEPDAVAHVHLPSRSLAHEITRRRRIVSTSLRGLWHQRGLFNPFRYGVYSLGLFINKVLRRLLPVFLTVLFVSSAALAEHFLFFSVLALQCVFYLGAITHMVLPRMTRRIPIVGKLLAVVAYFCVGNVGMLLGLLDFVGGRSIDRWEPVKGEESDSPRERPPVEH